MEPRDTGLKETESGISPANGETVLVVEDDRKTASLVAMYLEREGFRTLRAHDGRSGLEAIRREKPVFVILDIMLPLMDGWEVCRRMRAFSDAPVLMLTARSEEFDRVLGLTIGADDYLVKPFSPRELVARVKAILRRVGRSGSGPEKKLSSGPLVLDVEHHRRTLSGRDVDLTPFEFRLVEVLMSSPGRVFSREKLLGALYPGGEEVVERVIDVHVGKIRQKIEPDPAHPRFIHTVRGFGYRLEDRGPPPSGGVAP
jgi:DNA-binding response OmpR family regulator